MAKTDSWEDREIRKLKKGKKYFREEVPSIPMVTVVNNIEAPSFGGNTADEDLERMKSMGRH